jgi:hypothetical protein
MAAGGDVAVTGGVPKLGSPPDAVFLFDVDSTDRQLPACVPGDADIGGLPHG